jgi:SET domain-containing protein
MYRIDASYDDGSLARLVNDNHKRPNSVMRLVVLDGTPHLFLYALRDILVGQEICYNYGKGDHTKYPWRLKVETQVTFYSVTFCFCSR